MPLVNNYDNVMILRGLSKFYAAPGLRLGYGVTSNEDFLEVIRTNQNPWSVNSIGALAGELMLKDNAYISATRELICSERTKLFEAIKSIPELYAYEPIANFILVKILKEGVTSFDIFEFLIQRKMMIRDCASFESLKGEFIRFCIMSPEDNQKLINGLKDFFSVNH